MKVKDAMAALERCDPEAEIVREGPDHSYTQVNQVRATTGAKQTRRGSGWRTGSPSYFHWYGQENASDGEVPVLVVVLD